MYPKLGAFGILSLEAHVYGIVEFDEEGDLGVIAQGS